MLVRESMQQPDFTKLPSSSSTQNYIRGKTIEDNHSQSFLLVHQRTPTRVQKLDNEAEMNLAELDKKVLPAILRPRPYRTRFEEAMRCVIMNQQKKRAMTERGLEKSLRCIVTQVSRQKMLPKILCHAVRELGSKRLATYQRAVRRQYEQDTKAPLKYDPQEAKSDREKFREKILKLVNHQLEVDYLENVKVRDRTLITYQGHQLDQQPIKTKQQFEIFKNFNEKRFKETYSNLFEDRLQLDYDQLYYNKSKQRCKTLHILDCKDPTPMDSTPMPSPQRSKRQQKYTQSKPMQKHRILEIQSAKKPMLYFNDRKTVGPAISFKQQHEIGRIMREIGQNQGQGLTVTKQNIFKYLRSHYEKPNRIVDFLEIGQALNRQQFKGLCKRLRVMPQQHLLFMAFLYFDGNNDGYIDDYDLERLTNLALLRPVLAHDYQRIKQSGIKIHLTKQPPYMRIYQLPEVTQTCFFQWKRQNQGEEKLEDGGYSLEIKNRLLSSKQKHIFLDFEAFCHVYRNDKPFLWYDLLHILSGASFQGLKYS